MSFAVMVRATAGPVAAGPGTGLVAVAPPHADTTRLNTVTDRITLGRVISFPPESFVP